MNISNRLAPLVPALLLALPLALVSARPAAAAVNAWELVHPSKFDAGRVEHRQAIARDLLERVELLAAVIPPQSPEQTARLREEADRLEELGERASAQRRSRLYLSRAYQQRTLLDILGEASDALRCVLDSGSDQAREMSCWARASAQFLEQSKVDLALSVLRRSRAIPRDDDMPVAAMDPVVWYGEYGRGILLHIISPYLEGQAQ
jgi:hypothetical protein